MNAAVPILDGLGAVWPQDLGRSRVARILLVTGGPLAVVSP